MSKNLEPQILGAIGPNELRTKLTEGMTQFAFRKRDGSLRLALGTTNLDLVPIQWHPKGTGKTSDASVRYFDIQRQQWRSVSSREPIYLA
jgi:hypothetical protein